MASEDKLIKHWLATRRRARHDLLFLAKDILGYKDITQEFHGPVARLLQNFPAPLPHQWDAYERYEKGQFIYTPHFALYPHKEDPRPVLPGSRRRLLMDPRGTFKTTFNVVCHTIQWILNYPDITLLIVHAKQQWASRILMYVAEQFATNTKMREIFPDYCPARGKLKDFASQEELHCPKRTVKKPEPTVGIAGIASAITGAHYDVIKFSDIVERENTRTGNQIGEVIESFGYYRNILVRPESWMDVEGTPYDFSDLYQSIIDSETKKPIHQREWAIHVRGIYKKQLPPGQKDYTFIPEERDLPDMKDENGLPVSWMAERFSVTEMEKERQDPVIGGFVFASQRLCNPVDTGGDRPFPAKQMRQIEPADLVRVPMQYYTTTVDTAETDKDYSDFTTITTCGWDGYGRAYVIDIRHEKMLPDRFIDELISVYLKWRPLNIKLEETGYVRGLKPSLMRTCHLRGIYPNFDFVPRDNQQAKKDRILNTLQPYYKRGEIIFLSTLSVKEALVKELTQFPKYQRDDILDTLADQFQNREWFGRLTDRPGLETILAQNRDGESLDYHTRVERQRQLTALRDMMTREFNRMIGEPVADDSVGTQPTDPYFNSTGGL